MRSAGNVILVIDEVHTPLIGAELRKEPSMPANILKPALPGARRVQWHRCQPPLDEITEANNIERKVRPLRAATFSR